MNRNNDGSANLDAGVDLALGQRVSGCSSQQGHGSTGAGRQGRQHSRQERKHTGTPQKQHHEHNVVRRT